MSAQPGRNLTISICDSANTVQAVVTGLRLSEIAFKSTANDTTDLSSSGMWRVLLSDTGIFSAHVSASGILCDTNADLALRNAFFSQAINRMAICISDFGTVAGPFKISDLGYTGSLEAEIEYSVTLISAGVLKFKRP